MKKIIIFFTLGIFWVTCSSAGEVLRGQDIKRIIKDWAAEEGVKLEIMISDKRTFFACDGQTKVSPRNGDDLSILVFNCDAKNNPWQIYVRSKFIDAAGPVTNVYSENIVVAKTPIKKGSVIEFDDLQIINAEGISNFLFFSEIKDVVGRKAKRTIYRNQKIKPQHVSEIWLVEKDQRVILTNKIGRIIVETDGIALESGQKNDRIKVMNAKSGQVISGIVLSKKNIAVLTKMN